jgi:hypothetical protein
MESLISLFSHISQCACPSHFRRNGIHVLSRLIISFIPLRAPWRERCANCEKSEKSEMSRGRVA